MKQTNQTPSTGFETTRREFLATSATVSGGLVIGFFVPGPIKKAMAQTPPVTPSKVYPPNAFIQIAADSKVNIVINKCEMGQGVFTSMSQLIAEELDCDWKNVVPVAAPVDPVYNHTLFGSIQMTGGSTALTSSYEQYRQIGAAARAMLVRAAANKWQVEPSTLKTENGFVIGANGKIAYGELAEDANKLEMPTSVKMKDPKDFKIIGKPVPRLDAFDKSHGKAIYGIDARIPNLVRAMVVRPPVFGATLKSFDDSAARKVSGVLDVVKVGNKIAVLGKNSWAARQGRDAVKAEWNMNGKDQISNDSIMASFKKEATKPNLTPHASPDAVKEAAADESAFVAEYEFPYLAHAAMEPLNVTVNFDGKTAELWSGHQMPTVDRNYAAAIFGIANEKVKVNSVYAGGSFGRRASKDSDYVQEACEIAKVVKRPIQVLYSREDDMKGGYYRPMAYHHARISCAKNGEPQAWHHTIVSPSIMAGGAFAAMMSGGADPTVTEGVTESRYDVPKMQVDLQMPVLDIPTLWFRSVGHTHTGFVMETLMDELAHRAKKDPVEFRRPLLKKSSRHIAVLDLLKAKSPWGKKAPKGHAYGLAIHESFNSVVGHVVEVSIKDGAPKVHHVWSAAHVGRVVNPDGARSQVSGAIAFGISMVLYGKIEIEKGVVTTTNFDKYPVIRMNEMPKVDIYFVESDDKPTGLGEPGVPPVGPAIANALFTLTGKRIRKLPIQLT